MSKHSKKILAIVNDWRGANDSSFAKAFETAGCQLNILNNLQWFGNLNMYERGMMKILKRPTLNKLTNFNNRIIEEIERFHPDIVFIAKGIWIFNDTLREMKNRGILLIHWHPDDAFNTDNSSEFFPSSIPEYDLIVTPKSFNVSEYLNVGARRVLYLPYSYDPSIHYPVNNFLGGEVGSDIVFVGAMRKKRVGELQGIADEGFDVRIWGTGWNKTPLFSSLRKHCTFKPVYAEEMSSVFSASKIVLGFLNAENRDLHTARTFEVPACGGFLLAERTVEHKDILREDKEAVYFETLEELYEKARFYLRHDTLRMKIANAGYERVTSIGATYLHRVYSILKELDNI